MDSPRVALGSTARGADVFLLDDEPLSCERKPWDSNPQVALATGCFQDSVLIRPDGFLSKLRELESNQRPPDSESGVTTNSNYPAFNTSLTHFAITRSRS